MMEYLAVVKKEIVSILRERTIIIAILIQLFVASFSSALLVGMLSLYDTDTISQSGGGNVNIGLVNTGRDSGNAAKLTELLKAQGTKVAVFPSFEAARAEFNNNKIDAILVVPDVQKNLTVNLYLPQSETYASFIRVVIQKPLEEFENAIRLEQGVDIRYTAMKGKPSTSFEFIYSVILPILMFFPAFVAGGMVIDSLSEEVENNTLPTLLSAPISINNIVFAKVSAAVLTAAIQCVLWLGLLRLNRIYIQNQVWILILAILMAGIVAVLAGIVGVYFRDRERSQFVFSLLLIAAASASFMVDLSPMKILPRLAVGDYYTNGWLVVIFALALAGLGIVLRRTARRILV
jgi:ABC-2 type transport system permease protein